MKIKNLNVEIDEIGDFESIDSSIAKENMGLALQMVSKNLYSNPIGSFIRELTSNAVDANVDAEAKNPVVVHIYKDDNDIQFIEVKDDGTGMSPETFQNIYMSWFNSDKRNTNEKIGGWGLGSKSPLSYQDSFEIITRYNGIQYSYILATETDVPTATLLSKENTDKGNGTTIRVEIKDGDSYKVFTECKNQLTYFDNVYVKHEEYFYDNKFKIYESDNFKLRNNSFPFGKEMHICLGQVVYPINWNVLNFSEPIRIPVAVKFDIGELEVTLSREEISYTDNVKKTLKNKINKVYESLVKKYEEQLKIDDLFKYLKLLNEKTKPPLEIKDVKIDMSQSKANLFFSPFEDVKIKSDDILSIFSCYNVSHLKNGRKYDLGAESYRQYFNLRTYPHKCYIVNKNINYYDTLYINNGFLFKRGKLTPQRFRKLCNLLGLVHKEAGHDNTLNIGRYSDSPLLRRAITNKPILKQGAHKILYKVIKYIDNYLQNNIKHYDGIASKEWIDDIKQAETLKKEKTKGEITYYDINNRRHKIMLSELIDNHKIVFYIDRKEDKEKIQNYLLLYNNTFEYFQKNTFFIIASKTVIKSLKRFDNCMKVENIFKGKILKRNFYKYKLVFEIRKLSQFSNIFNYSKYYSDMFDKLYDTYVIPTSELKSITSLYLYFENEINSIRKENDYYIFEEYIEILNNFAKKAEILNYIKSDTPNRIILKIIKENKLFKLKPKFYNNSENVKAKALMMAKIDRLNDQIEQINNPNIY